MNNEKRRIDIVEAITFELHGVTFVSLAVFKDCQLVDIITKQPDVDDGGFSVIVDAIFTHDIGPVELRSDSEHLFRQTLSTPGILGHIVSREELSLLYRQLTTGSKEYEAICAVYELDDGSKPEPKHIGWMARVINWVSTWIRGRLQAVSNRFKNNGEE